MLLWCLPVCADDSAMGRNPAWPDTFVARVEAVALLQTLNANLLSHDSATLTLERWCGVHRLASPARIVAVRVPDRDKPVSPEQRRELGVTPAEPIHYRRVRLMCGTVVLSEADNWYVPGRLTAEMNKSLDSTDMPFGKVVQALHFQRHTLSSTLLWSPLPEGWEMNPIPPSDPSAVLTIPSELLQHRALLTLPDGTPFSEVVETYTAGVLAFPVPGP
jgi:chorismate-pyruvate lyase